MLSSLPRNIRIMAFHDIPMSLILTMFFSISTRPRSPTRASSICQAFCSCSTTGCSPMLSELTSHSCLVYFLQLSQGCSVQIFLTHLSLLLAWRVLGLIFWKRSTISCPTIDDHRYLLGVLFRILVSSLWVHHISST